MTPRRATAWKSGEIGNGWNTACGGNTARGIPGSASVGGSGFLNIGFVQMGIRVRVMALGAIVILTFGLCMVLRPATARIFRGGGSAVGSAICAMANTNGCAFLALTGM
jgi:hypothetical protein